jgi:hypothetical protein
MLAKRLGSHLRWGTHLLCVFPVVVDHVGAACGTSCCVNCFACSGKSVPSATRPAAATRSSFVSGLFTCTHGQLWHV